MKETRSSKGLQRPKLSREGILEVALGLAQKYGLEEVSMRRVAGVLKVEAMSLYKHVENKDDLLDGVIELIIKKIELPTGDTPWRQALHERAMAERRVLSEHSWIIHLLEARSGTGLVRLEHQNHMIGILRRAGFSVELAFQTMIIITGYVYGFVVFATAWNFKSKERSKTLKKAQQQIRPETHPYIVEVISFAQNRSLQKEAKSDLEFQMGLDLLLDGIEKSLSS